jgi:hypothetical protein
VSSQACFSPAGGFRSPLRPSQSPLRFAQRTAAHSFLGPSATNLPICRRNPGATCQPTPPDPIQPQPNRVLRRGIPQHEEQHRLDGNIVPSHQSERMAQARRQAFASASPSRKRRDRANTRLPPIQPTSTRSSHFVCLNWYTRAHRCHRPQRNKIESQHERTLHCISALKAHFRHTFCLAHLPDNSGGTRSNFGGSNSRRTHAHFLYTIVRNAYAPNTAAHA